MILMGSSAVSWIFGSCHKRLSWKSLDRKVMPAQLELQTLRHSLIAPGWLPSGPVSGFSRCKLFYTKWLGHLGKHFFSPKESRATVIRRMENLNVLIIVTHVWFKKFKTLYTWYKHWMSMWLFYLDKEESMLLLYAWGTHFHQIWQTSQWDTRLSLPKIYIPIGWFSRAKCSSIIICWCRKCALYEARWKDRMFDGLTIAYCTLHRQKIKTPALNF